jgi:hypothetical protein
MSRSRRLTAAWTRRAAVSSPVRCPAKLSRRRDASDRSTALRHLRLTPPALTAQKAERINPTAAAKPIEIDQLDGKSASYMDRSRKEGRRERTCARMSVGSRSMSPSAPSPSPWRCFSSISIFSRLLLWEKLRGEACGARVLVPRRAPSRHPRTRT